MNFAQPLWLLAGLIAGSLLIWRYRRFDARQRAELTTFASTNLVAQLTSSVSTKRRHFKRALIVLGVACLAVALARPLLGFRWEEAKRKGLDLLFAVDTSKSMLAQDVKPDRLTRAKMAVEDLLARLDGDRAGLIAFAGNAFLQCPLTLDYDAFRQSLDALDTHIIPRGGTDIAAAIHEAEAALEGNGNNERILVLLTDGEDLEGNALDAARHAAKNGLKIFTVGVGGANGELIPLVDEHGGTGFAKEASGQLVKSHLDEGMLKQIAEATGALYQPLGQQGQGLEMVYQQGLAKLTRREVASRKQKVYIERFQWPLGLGLLCLALEPLVGIRRRKSVKSVPVRPAQAAAWNRIARPARALATAAAVIAAVALAPSVFASPQKGEQAFQKGDYAQAEEEYRQAATRNPNQPVLQFNHGAAAYKAANFPAAAQSFAQATKTEDLKLQQDDLYNLGNAQYRLGQQTEKANAQETIKTWESAVQSYEAALKLKADDADAKYNRDLVKHKLEQLKQQQNQDQKKQNDEQDKKDGASGKPEQQDQKHDDQKKDQKQGNQGSQEKDPGDGAKPDQPPKPGSGQGQAQPNPPKDQPNGQQDNSAQTSPQQQKPAPKAEGSQAGQKPEQAKKDGEIKGRQPAASDPAQDQADTQREPGKMSREEAKQLLDSLKSGDRKMPLAPSSRGQAASRDDEPIKDW